VIRKDLNHLEANHFHRFENYQREDEKQFGTMNEEKSH
jgi:hypothetical protein